MKAGEKLTRYPAKSLGELEACGVVSLGRGKVISKRDLAAAPGTYPVYSSAKENDGKFGEYGEFMFDEELITWSVDGGGRLFHRRKHRFSVTNVGGTLRVNRPDELDCRFLFFMLSYLHSIVVFDWVQKAHPSVIRKVYDTVPIPPIEEQRRIVAMLDEAFAAISNATANAEKNLANVRSFLDQYLRDFFSELEAERSPLSTIADFRNGLNFTGTSKGELIKIVGVKDFQDNLHVPVEGLATVQTDGPLADIDVLSEGDILTVRSNGNRALIGRCMIAGEQSEKISHSGFTICIRSRSSSVDTQFLCRILKSPAMRDQLVSGGGGANISNLNQKALAALQIPLPPLWKQRVIVERLDDVEVLVRDLHAIIDRKIAAFGNLKQSLLHRAFSGELAAAAPNLVPA